MEQGAVPDKVAVAAREWNNYTVELARVTAHAKQLREDRAKRAPDIYNWMAPRGLDKWEGITIRSVAPKKKRKTAQEKKLEAMNLFSREGIKDPEVLWLRLRELAKTKPPRSQDQDDEGAESDGTGENVVVYEN